MTKDFPVGAGLPANGSDSGKVTDRGQARSYILVPAMPGQALHVSLKNRKP